MDILKHISDSNDRDIIVSLPKDKSWLEYLAHFLELKASGGYVEVILDIIPRTVSGKRCYVVYDGFLKGWMEIYRIKETQDNDICIELIPYLNGTLHDIPMNDIDGFKYFFDDFNKQ